MFVMNVGLSETGGKKFAEENKYLTLDREMSLFWKAPEKGSASHPGSIYKVTLDKTFSKSRLTHL